MHDPALAANLVRVLSAQIADRELAVAIALEPRVERRLLLKLRQLAERWGRVTPDGIRLDLRLTHQELANMVGAVRESVTIALGRLASAGRSRCATAPCSSARRRTASAGTGPRPPTGDPAPAGALSLRGSLIGRAGGTIRARGGEVELTVRPRGAVGRARAVQLADGASAWPCWRAIRPRWPPRCAAAWPSTRTRPSSASGSRTTRSSARGCGGAPGCARSARDRRPGGRRRRGRQLITWAEAAAIEARVVAAAAPRSGGLRAPPTREEIGALSPAELAARGLSPGRASTLARLLRTLDPEALAGHGSPAVLARLTRERGIGPWSAGVIALYGLGRLDVGRWATSA